MTTESNTNNVFFQSLAKLAVDRSKSLVNVVAASITEEPPTSVIPEAAQGVRYAVVYNQASFDSVYAAAQLVAADGLNVVACIPHGYLDEADSLLGHDHLLVVGTELSKNTLTALHETSTSVTLFAYRDCYPWLTEKIKDRWGERLEVVFPSDDNVSELTTLTDNTAIWMTFGWLYQRSIQVSLPLIDMSRVTAMRLTSLAFPVLPDLSPVGSKAAHNEEIRYKAILFNLLPAVRTALRSKNPLQKLTEIDINTNTDAYMEHWRAMGHTYQRGSADQSFRAGSRVLSVPTIACTEMLHYDILTMSSTHHDTLVTYEDVYGLRIWRVFARDRSTRMALLSALGGHEVWMEGVCACTYTKVRTLID